VNYFDRQTREEPNETTSGYQDAQLEYLNHLIDSKIRQHEVRVAIISGLLGTAIVAGMFHAIYLNHISLLNG
jgi:hypothetical protein